MTIRLPSLLVALGAMLPALALGAEGSSLVHPSSGRCLTLGAPSDATGEYLAPALVDCGGATDQQWRLDEQGRLKSLATLACLTSNPVRHESAVAMRACWTPEQQWEVVAKKDGFLLRHRASGRCLRQTGNGVSLRDCNEGPESRWAWKRVSRKERTLVSQDGGRCLFVEWSPGEGKTPVLGLAPCVGTNDLWRLDETNRLREPRQGLCVAPSTEGLTLANCTKAPDQTWDVVNGKDGFALRHGVSRTCLDRVLQGVNDSLRLRPCVDERHQRWDWDAFHPGPADEPPAPAHGPMSDQPFAEVLAAVRAARPPTDRVRVFEIGVADERLSCEQLVHGLGWLQEERDRLRLVRFVAPRLVDRNCWPRVAGKFTSGAAGDAAKALLE